MQVREIADRFISHPFWVYAADGFTVLYMARSRSEALAWIASA